MTCFDASTAGNDVAALAEVLAEIGARAAECGADLLLVGAAARDLLLCDLADPPLLRATADVDVAVAVQSWSQFDDLAARFPRAGRSVHRLRVLGVEVDVIPFGGVETEDRSIRWPDDHVMDVLGFEEAFRSAVRATLPGGTSIRVASLPAQVVLKLLAWHDRHLADTRDAPDLLALLDAYGSERHADELYEHHVERLERHDYDAGLAAADRMGYEAARLLDPAGRERVVAIVEAECSDEGTLASYMSLRIGRNRELLRGLLLGMRTAGG